MDVWIEVVAECLCGQSKGILTAYPSGGQGPYTFLWSTGATTPTIENLAPGSYSVTVTDANLDQATAEEQLIGTASFGDWGSILPLDVHGFGYCAGSSMFGKSNLESPMLSNYAHYGPFTYAGGSTVPYMMQGACGTYGPVIDFMGPVGESVSIPFEDASGCPGTMSAFIPIPWPGEQLPLEVLSVTGSCSNMANGTVLLAFGSIMDLYYGACNEAQVRLKVSGGNYYPNNCSSYSLSCSGGSRMITGLAPGTYEAYVLPYSWGITSPDRLDCGPSLEFTVPALGTDCGLVTGRAYMDYNLNCTRQTNEPYVPGGIVEVLPGPVYTVTDAQGLYSLALPTGSYTLQQQSDLLGEHCTGGPIPFTINGGQTTTVPLPDTSSVPLDVQAMLASGAARPGFQFNYGITVRNLTPAASGAASLTFTFDPTITYVSATPNPSSVSGNTITWNQAQLTAFQQRNYTVRFQVPPDVGLLGYELVATASVSTANTDGNLANNTATNLRTITGAYDPNDKLAYTSNGSTEVWQLNEDEWIDYTIRFQNTGTDTA
ncbi:MAG: hypothetical protein KF905_14955, partial [Flavobacteriales bacterium]|nr:hypothetical protein [Flavobacteriales bacterium]